MASNSPAKDVAARPASTSPPTEATERVLDHKTVVQSARASFSGTAIEWYDYFLYGAAAAAVFPQLFFSEFGDTGALLASLASFGAAFVLRPLGGVIFGHFGDRISRKQALVATLMIMGVGTFLIGLLPTVDQVGILAPILLVALRMAQGIGMGGEWGGAALLIVENSPSNRRAYYASAAQLGVPAGQILSSAMLAAFTLLPDDQFYTWGWRVPFLFSGLLVAIGLYVRTKLEEPKVFQELEDAHDRPSLPIGELFRNAKKTTFLLLFASGATTICYTCFTVFSVSYVKNILEVSSGYALSGVLVAAFGLLVLMPVYAALSDRFGRKVVYLTANALVGILAFPCFMLLNTKDPALIIVAVALPILIGYGPAGAIHGVLYAEQYPTRYRYTGTSVAYQFSSMIAGAPAALIMAALLASTGSSNAIAWYLIIGAVISFVCTAGLEETYREELR